MTVLMIIMTVMNIAMKGVERCIMKSLFHRKMVLVWEIRAANS